MFKETKNKITFLVVTLLLASLFGLAAGGMAGFFFYQQVREQLAEVGLSLPQAERVIEREQVIEREYLPQTSQEEAIIKTVKDVSPLVVSIIITKDLPVLEEFFISPFEGFERFFGQPFDFKIPRYRQKGTEKKQVGGGTGFIVAEDGLVLTNKHVVLDEAADYTILTNEGKMYPAKVLARDPFQDLAVLKIQNSDGRSFEAVKIGDSDKIQVGQTVVAIGNALGEFRNTVSVGVISGLERQVTATGGGFTETIENLIQTDAAINRGNSGGPLLNLAGEVIGVNTAMAQGAENIGFAIPINTAKKDIEQVRKKGKISYPFLGVCWTQVTSELKEKAGLPVDYGALIQKGQGCEQAIAPGSAAEKVGLREGDIILEWDSEKLTPERSLGKIIQEHQPGDKVGLTVLRGEQEMFFEVALGERSQ